MPGRNERTLLRMVDFVEDGATAYVLASATTTIHHLQKETPVDTRHARSAYTAGIGSPAPGFPEVSSAAQHSVPTPVEIVRRGTAGFKLGDDLVVGNRAAHSALIAGGRRRGTRGMLGSNQAPVPYIPIALDSAKSVMVGWRHQG